MTALAVSAAAAATVLLAGCNDATGTVASVDHKHHALTLKGQDQQVTGLTDAELNRCPPGSSYPSCKGRADDQRTPSNKPARGNGGSNNAPAKTPSKSKPLTGIVTQSNQSSKFVTIEKSNGHHTVLDGGDGITKDIARKCNVGSHWPGCKNK
jgi:hypothetical protein